MVQHVTYGLKTMVTLLFALLWMLCVNDVAGDFSICSEDFQLRLQKLRTITRNRNAYFYKIFDRAGFIPSDVTNIWDYINFYHAFESGLFVFVLFFYLLFPSFLPFFISKLPFYSYS